MKLPLFFLKASMYLFPDGFAALIARLSSGVCFLVFFFLLFVVSIMYVLDVMITRFNDSVAKVINYFDNIT